MQVLIRKYRAMENQKKRINIFGFSYRAVDINELMSDTKFLCDMLAQCLYPISLGGMMPGRNKSNAGLAGFMNGSLGNFPGDKRIYTQTNSLIEIILSTAGTPGYARHRLQILADYQRLAPQDAFDIHAQSFQVRHIWRKHAVHGNILDRQNGWFQRDLAYGPVERYCPAPGERPAANDRREVRCRAQSTAQYGGVSCQQGMGLHRARNNHDVPAARLRLLLIAA